MRMNSDNKRKLERKKHTHKIIIIIITTITIKVKKKKKNLESHTCSNKKNLNRVFRNLEGRSDYSFLKQLQNIDQHVETLP